MHLYPILPRYIKLIPITVVCFIVSCAVSKDREVPFHLSAVETDSFFESKQKIYHLSLGVDSDYTVDIGHSESILIKTSEIAKQNNAVAAVNGSFFDVGNGGSVVYLEKNDTVISYTQKTIGLINGILLMSDNGEIEIGSFKSDKYYEESTEEYFAIATGPILLKDSEKQEFIRNSFTGNRHPRTCFCKTRDSIVFVVVDGRSEIANGMSLFELQQYLLTLGCIDAINLDGGGSSTMWLENKGVVNNPSGSKGERSVANALLLVRKK